MNKLSQTFIQVLQKGLDSAKMITEPDKKALAYAEIAKAIAATGLVEDGAVDTTEAAPAEKEVKKDTAKKGTSKKDALKPEAGKGTPAPKEEKEEAPPVPEDETPAQEDGEVEIEEEWTDAMTELKSDSLERLKAYVENWGEDYIYNDCVGAFFESAEVTGKDNIRPTNIDGFVTYLDQLAESFAAEEQQ